VFAGSVEKVTMPSSTRLFWREAFLALALLLAGCSSPEQVQIRMNSASNVNEQRSVYVLVRAVQEADYRTESYDEVAAKVVHPDESVLEMSVALPGVPLSFSQAAPAKGRLAVYAFFERPRCGAWRVLLPEEAPPTVDLRLSDGKLCLVGERGECVASPCVSERMTADQGEQ
jgi:hypothetical protein